MSYLPFTILAYFLNSVTVTIDKFLLSKHIAAPLVYVFYFSAFSLVALILLPFTNFPTTLALFYSSLSTLLWTAGAYCMFKALQKGSSSRVIPLIGTLIPIFLLLQAQFYQTLNSNEVLAVFFLIVGIIFLTFSDLRGKLVFSEMFFILLSALLFAISYLVLRQAYLIQDFLTVLVWSRMILLPLGLLLVLLPKTRGILFPKDRPILNPLKKMSWLFIIGQVAGGSSQLLLTFSISLANPTLVNSIQGIQYVFLLILGAILAKYAPQAFKEHYSKKQYLVKIFGIILIGLGLYILAFARSSSPTPTLGVTFSPMYAKQLGLDPKMTYLYVLNDLNVKAIRFPLYWSEVEKVEGEYDFEEAKFYLDEAQRKGVKIILGVGMKQPRWPECFIPPIYQNLSDQQKEQKILTLLGKEVEFFKNYPNIIAWQVENEPLLPYGVCPNINVERLKNEVKLVKQLDSRPIMITDSGELSNWMESMNQSDLLGISIYRVIWDQNFGFINYPFPSLFYKGKYDFISLLNFKKPQTFIISELQAEPWAPERKNIYDLSFEEQKTIYPAQILPKNLEYAKETGAKQIYFWGVEWWYYMKLHGYPDYWTKATDIFHSSY